MSTDQEWVRWGRQDPYFAVITNDKFRRDNLTEQAKEEFFESGRYHVNYVLDACRRMIGADFKPSRALDFGCGVGRVALPLAEQVAHVVGVDVSPDMLAETRRNADRLGLGNVDLLKSDDGLSAVTGVFDLVHSCITFQHIDPSRGRFLFERLIALIAPGGAGAIQITYAKAYHPDTFGQPPRPTAQSATGTVAKQSLPSPAAPAEPIGDPEMQMNPYSLSDLAFILQTAGIPSFRVDFTDHGGELGVFLFFHRPR